MKEIVDSIINFLRIIGLCILAPIWGLVLISVMITDCANTK